MIRLLLLLAVLAALPTPGRAQPAVIGFDAATAASVWGTALAYIAPRSLAPLTIPQMAIWGLNGLAALDPDLNTTLQNGDIRLYGPDQLIIAVPAPAPDDATGWGNAAAAVAKAAYRASPALQQAGTAGIIANFFDELFNHFDPYSRYEPPAQAAQDQLMITGLAGTGLQFARQGNSVAIAAVTADSPAANAGLTPGTLILSADGKPAYPYEITRLNNDQNGIAGTSTVLRVADPSDPTTPQDVTLTRAYIPPQTVFAVPAPAPGLIALKITGFNEGTSDQFTTILANAMSADPPPTGLLVDLRGNRGGILRQAVLVADSLLPRGIIATAAGRDPDADRTFKAEGADITGGLKIILLVDGQTASAAEIFSAALADNRRAVVVGSETLGKGLVQTITSLPDGGELFITWSRVLAPRGWPLQTLGVMPQICTSLGPQALKTQLDDLAAGKNPMAPVLARARAVRAPVAVDKILSIRDACPAAIGSDLDLTASAFLISHPNAYNAALLPNP
ncbi:MAG: S41 family peptidase [Acidocella sp.]|nr:S41 family peptidase [Acidocella sp.]